MDYTTYEHTHTHKYVAKQNKAQFFFRQSLFSFGMKNKN